MWEVQRFYGIETLVIKDEDVKKLGSTENRMVSWISHVTEKVSENRGNKKHQYVMKTRVGGG